MIAVSCRALIGLACSRQILGMARIHARRARRPEAFSEYDLLVSGLEPQQEAAEPDAPIVVEDDPAHIKTDANASDKGNVLALTRRSSLTIM